MKKRTVVFLILGILFFLDRISDVIDDGKMNYSSSIFVKGASIEEAETEVSVEDLLKRIEELEKENAELSAEIERGSETEANEEKLAGSDASMSEFFSESEEPQMFEVQKPVIYKGYGTTVQITDIIDSRSSFDIKVNILNDSDLNLGFNARAYAVNGIMTGNSIYDMDCDVAAHRQANTTLKLEKDFLEKYNISKVKKIDLLLWAYDNDRYRKEFESGQLTIRTTDDDGFYDEMVSGETVYEKEGLKVDYLGHKGNEYTFTLINNLDTYLSFDVNNLTINGFTTSANYTDLYNILVHKGCQAIFTIEPEDEFLKGNGISDVTTVEFTLRINPREMSTYGWSTEMITVTE